ncbi:hypothetical protein AWE58_20725 [Escherichia coli]|nr:hypothetical protein AWE58_20725 [Escherichia coli]
MIQFRQRFREGQTVAVKQILMLLVLFREHIQQHGMRFTHVHVEAHAVHLTERYVLQALVEHTDTVLLALNGFTDDVRHAAGTDRQFLFAGR